MDLGSREQLSLVPLKPIVGGDSLQEGRSQAEVEILRGISFASVGKTTYDR